MSNNNIQVIQTEYNCFKFRSRLEARWAIFFDSLGIKYEYETEGYELSGGVKYLPDFYLPEFDKFVEVKGMNEHIRDDLDKLRLFVCCVKKSVIILSAIPFSNEAEGLYLFPTLHFSSKSKGKAESAYCFFTKYIGCDVIDEWLICRENEWYWNEFMSNETIYNTIQAICGNDENDSKEACFVDSFGFTVKEDHSVRTNMKNYLQEIQNAIIKARQARFEYGEKG